MVLYSKRCLGFWVTTKRLITLLPTSQLIGCRSVTIHHNHFNSTSCWPDHLDTCCTPFAFFSPLILQILIVYIFDSFNFPYETQPLCVKGDVSAFSLCFPLPPPKECLPNPLQAILEKNLSFFIFTNSITHTSGAFYGVHLKACLCVMMWEVKFWEEPPRRNTGNEISMVAKKSDT